MNIKSIQWFQIKTPINKNPEELDQILEQRRCRPCPTTETETSGWVSPFGQSSDVLCHSANGYLLLTIQKETRLLPATVIKDALEEKIQHISDTENRSVGRKEKKRIKEEVQFTLLPKAFVKKTQTNVYIDTKKQILAVCCSSKNQADQITSLLRNTLGSLNIAPIDTEINPSVLMSRWLLSNTLPGQLRFGEDCEMIDKEQGGIKFNKQDLMHNSVLQHLKEGKTITKLSLFWQNTASFCFNKDFSLSKIKWIDVDLETGPLDGSSEQQSFDAAFVLMTGILSEIMADILNDANSKQASPELEHVQ